MELSSIFFQFTTTTSKNSHNKSIQSINWQSSFDDLDLGESMFGGDGVNRKSEINTEKRAIFVGNLPFTVTNEELKRLAEENGVSSEAIMSSRIATKFNTGRSRGFGYLEFSSELEALKNLEKMKENAGETGLILEDRVLKLDLDHVIDGPHKGRRTARTNPNYSLFLGNLDFSLDNLAVEEFVRHKVEEE